VKAFVISVVCFACLIGCQSQTGHSAGQTIGVVHRPEDALTESQRKVLDDWTHGLKTRNSVADIGRLKDSVNRWDELFMDPAPPELKPVFAILKGRVQERIAELEAEAVLEKN
jgi:hypothetical protein